MEGFKDGALLLRLEDRHLIEVSPTAHHVLEQTDGRRTVSQVAVNLAETYQVSEAEALGDTLSLYAQLTAQGIVEIVEPGRDDREDCTMKNTSIGPAQYIRNPDVVLREEDEDGGLLFNPDTNQVKVVNGTGLHIWKQCDGTRDLAEIVTVMKDAFDEVPPDEVAEDVREFVEGMIEAGFIGTVKALDIGG